MRRAAPFVLPLALALAVLVAVAVGPVPLSLADVLRGLGGALGLSDVDPRVATIVASVRLPRALAGALVGAALASAGVALQALFRNPLADAGLLGVSSGGALGSALVIVLGGEALAAAGPLAAAVARPLAAFVGGAAATLLVLRVGRRAGQTDVGVMLLAGVALNAMVGAALGLLSHLASDAQLRDVTHWTLGNLGATTWRTTLAAAPALLACPLLLPLRARQLDAYQLGEDEARHLGVATDALVLRVVLLSALAAGGAVALAGLLGFVGLVVPHLARLLVGGSHRGLVVAAPLLGATLLVGADTCARVVAPPAELPVGVLTAALGAPFFFALVLRERRRVAGAP